MEKNHVHSHPAALMPREPKRLRFEIIVVTIMGETSKRISLLVCVVDFVCIMYAETLNANETSEFRASAIPFSLPVTENPSGGNSNIYWQLNDG